MTPIREKSGIAHASAEVLAALIGWLWKVRRATRTPRLPTDMPRERLRDMGLTPPAGAGHRTSGESGPVPKAELW